MSAAVTSFDSAGESSDIVLLQPSTTARGLCGLDATILLDQSHGQS